MDRGLRRSQVARELGISAVTVANWETNRTAVTARFLPRVVAFLRYDPGQEASVLVGTEAHPEGLQEV